MDGCLVLMLTLQSLTGMMKIQAGQMVAESSDFEESPLSTGQTAG